MTNSTQDIRVRIAPSPTGDWHLGTLRTALFSYLFARHHDGKFFLRIEDTDQTRLVPGAVERIQEMLEWLDLVPDPLPDGQPYFVQSQNLPRYQAVAKQLVNEGKAYYCFATPEELAAMREDQEAKKLPPHYDNRWGYRDLSLEEAEKLIAQEKPRVIRQKMPHEGTTVFHDTIVGEVKVENKVLDDTVLLKSDGFPTYHLAHVVDDYDMEISHVIRGAEWLPSAPRHVQLHQTLGWELPVYAHVPVILGPDKGKLSKRHGAKSVLEYRDEGYLPEAMLNFLVLLGWSSGTEQEIFSRSEMIEKFSLDRVHPSPAVFNKDRLDWFNATYIRNLGVMELRNLLLLFWRDRNPLWQVRYGENPMKFDKAVQSLHERLITLHEFDALANFYYEEPSGYDPDLLVPKQLSRKEVGDYLTLALKVLGDMTVSSWSHNGLEDVLRDEVARLGIKPGHVFWPIRAALTGLPASPGVFEVLGVLGKEESLKRIRHAQVLLQSYEAAA